MEEAKGTQKRDFIRGYEQEIQKIWDEEKPFDLDAPHNINEAKEKFLATFPYPYMNGRFHIGHAFTVSKVDIAAGYERMKGKNSLFPFGFHCTGMPIKVSCPISCRTSVLLMCRSAPTSSR